MSEARIKSGIIFLASSRSLQSTLKLLQSHHTAGHVQLHCILFGVQSGDTVVKSSPLLQLQHWDFHSFSHDPGLQPRWSPSHPLTLFWLLTWSFPVAYLCHLAYVQRDRVTRGSVLTPDGTAPEPQLARVLIQMWKELKISVAGLPKLHVQHSESGKAQSDLLITSAGSGLWIFVSPQSHAGLPNTVKTVPLCPSVTFSIARSSHKVKPRNKRKIHFLPKWQHNLGCSV